MYTEFTIISFLGFITFIKLTLFIIFSSIHPPENIQSNQVDFHSAKSYLNIGHPFFDFPEDAKNPLPLGKWPGTSKGKIIDGVISQCKDSEEENIPATSAISFYKWKGKSFHYDKDPKIASYYNYFNRLSLSVSSKEDCPPHLKQCGLLDLKNNKMCVDKEKACPINMLIYSNSSEPPKYPYNFKRISFNDGTYLYYTNEAIDKHIIEKIKVSDSLPCIFPNDFKTDYPTYILEKYGDNKCGSIDEKYYRDYNYELRF